MFVVDRITKSLVVAQVPYGTEVPVIGRWVSIINVHNSGAAFGVAPALAGFFLALFETATAKMRVFRVPEFLGAALMLGLLGTLLLFVSRSM